MLLQAYGEVELEGCRPMTEGATEDVRGHIDFPYALNTERLESGELVDVDSLDRALEIAARSSAAPGPRAERLAPAARRTGSPCRAVGRPRRGGTLLRSGRRAYRQYP
jgi:hypothetical protein